MLSLLFLGLTVLGLQDGEPRKLEGPPAATPEGWMEFTPTDRSFRADFPSEPKQVSRTAPISGGRRVPVVSFEVDSVDGVTYLASYTDYPKGMIEPKAIDGLYDRQAAGMAGRGGKLVYQSKVIVDGHTGRDFEVVIKQDQEQLILARGLIVGDRAYQIMCIGPVSLDRDRANAFLDSFRPTPR